MAGALMAAEDALAGRAGAVADWPADRVERRAVADLVPYARNARQHSTAQVEDLARSIQAFGFTVPVLIGPEGGIIAGHGRVLAAQMLGLAHVPVVVAAGWSDAKRRAYVLADNRIAEKSAWDMDLVRFELGELQSAFDLDLTGFSLADLFPAEETVAAEPEAPITVSRPGDVWILGDHRLTVGTLGLEEADKAIRAWQRAAKDEALLEASGEGFGQTRARRYGERAHG
jgi:ParB-like chromosome segregation protein Spo0J